MLKFYQIWDEDELRTIVMDEFVDGWNRKTRHDYGAQHFEEWWKRDLPIKIRRRHVP